MGLYVEGATFDTPQLCCGVVHFSFIVAIIIALRRSFVKEFIVIAGEKGVFN